MKTPFIEIVSFPEFHTVVAVICGSVKAIDQSIRGKRTTLIAHRKNAAIFAGQWSRVKEKGDLVKGTVQSGTGDLAGRCLSMDGDVYLWLPKWHAESFVHELFHAAEFVREEIGSTCPEVGAYVCEYVYKCVMMRQRKKAQE